MVEAKKVGVLMACLVVFIILSASTGGMPWMKVDTEITRQTGCKCLPKGKGLFFNVVSNNFFSVINDEKSF